MTEQWLNKHGFKYHGMVMGKPRGGNYHWIDDREVRATRYEGHFTDLVERSATVGPAVGSEPGALRAELEAIRDLLKPAPDKL